MEGKEIRILTVMVMLWWSSAGNCQTFDSIVAKDGSGDFETIAEAINAAPEKCLKPYYIHVKEGIYEENVTISYDKTNIGLVGDGIGVTIITANKSAQEFVTPNTATLEVYGSGFIGMNMTIRNTAGAIGNQAVALTNAPYHGVASYFQCSFEGFQDTVFVQEGSAFFRECNISGTIDFICGEGQAIFQNSVVIARTPLYGQGIRIVAPGAGTVTPNPGIILQNCTISTESDFNKSSISSFLGWPWKDHGTAVIMSSFIDDFIDPKGWLQHENVTNLYFAEYDNRGPGSDTEGRVTFSQSINETEASKFTVRNFIEGDIWIPEIIPYYLDLC